MARGPSDLGAWALPSRAKLYTEAHNRAVRRWTAADHVSACLQIHRLAKTLFAVSGASTELTLEPRLFH